ncbi:MAG: hypothetical protein LC660_08085 [Desulfobacteraceae bacterium]|nr:hypothetical protein [Desulfobacteraceae bacterium]
MSVLRAAIAQMNPVLGDMDENLRTHLQYIKEAKSKGVRLLLFPELSLSGYKLGADTINLAIRNNAQKIQELARHTENIHVIIGCVEEGTAAQFYNSSIVVADGEIEYVHRKLNLANYGRLDEGKYFGTGRYVETFHIDSQWKASVLICAVIDPFGKTLAIANGDSEQLLIADIDYAQVRLARFHLPTVRDSNLELVCREINRIADYNRIPPCRKTT